MSSGALPLPGAVERVRGDLGVTRPGSSVLDSNLGLSRGGLHVAGVCANLLLSYQRNSVGVDGNGGDEGGSGGF